MLWPGEAGGSIQRWSLIAVALLLGLRITVTGIIQTGQEWREQGRPPFWPLVLAVAVLAVWVAGTPHLRVGYECADRSCETYRGCTYWGLSGQYRVVPEPGEGCPTIDMN